MASEAVKKNILFNLRNHPREEIKQLAKNYTDDKLLELYEMFAQSDEHGNNDKHFADWLKD